MNDWGTLAPALRESIWETLLMVAVTLVVGGLLGLAFGLALNVTRPGGILAQRAVHTVLNVLVNIVRPIPFIIFITAVGPLTLSVMGSTVGTRAVLFPLALAATFGISRIVEQNLVSVDPAVIEAAQAMGASPWRIIRTVLVPEALGPLILGFTFALVAIVDMTAVAGAVSGGGLGQFAISYGYQRFDWTVTCIAVVLIIILVQAAQFTGNALSRRVMRR